MALRIILYAFFLNVSLSTSSGGMTAMRNELGQRLRDLDIQLIDNPLVGMICLSLV